jgi:hypothetical protein
MMEAVSTSEKSVNLYETTRRNNPEESSSYSQPLEPEISLNLSFIENVLK